MADPVTNIQIEDVLSSIRRLVAEGDRSRPTPANAAPHMAQPAPAATIPAVELAPAPVVERFVLTPALRVIPDAATPEPEGDAVAAEPVPAPPPSPRSALEATIAELEAAVTGQPDEWEPDGSESVPVMDWSTLTPQESVFVARNLTTLRLVPGAQVTEIAPEPTPEPAPEPAAEAEPEISFHRAHTEARPEPTAQAVTDADPGNYLASDAVIDEETLRALVADIVRQELQGALGERITRNVRKLVRREIHRVLASQEFD